MLIHIYASAEIFSTHRVKNMGKIKQNQTTTKQDKAQTMVIILGMLSKSDNAQNTLAIYINSIDKELLNSGQYLTHRKDDHFILMG